MRGLTVENGKVDNIAIFKELPDGWIACPDGVGMGWTDNGDGTFSPPFVDPAALTVSDYIDKIQRVLDEKAQSMGYDNIFTAVTYADDPTVAKFQAEGTALRRWRSLVWEYAYAVLSQVESGAIEQPTIEDFIAGAPVYE